MISKKILGSCLVLVLLMVSAAIVYGFSVTGKVVDISPTAMVVAEQCTGGTYKCDSTGVYIQKCEVTTGAWATGEKCLYGCVNGACVDCKTDVDCKEIVCSGSGAVHELCVDGKCTLNAQCPGCELLWWFDNTHKECSQKSFCGAYMYADLRTFRTEAECKAALPPIACTLDVKECLDGSYVSRVPPSCEFAPCPGCITLWWLDSTYRECSQKQFCGASKEALLYQGVETFETKDACEAALKLYYSPCDVTCQKKGYAYGECRAPAVEAGTATQPTSYCGTRQVDVGVDGCPQVSAASTTDTNTGGSTVPNYPIYHCCCGKEKVCPVETAICEKGYVPEAYTSSDGCKHWKCVKKECPEITPQPCKEGMKLETYAGDDGCKRWRCVNIQEIACQNKGGYCVSSGTPCREGFAQSEALGCPAVTSSAGSTEIRAYCCLPSTPITSTPECAKIGTDNEGWYTGGKLIKLEKCGCVAQCKETGSEKEGYYNSCTGGLIVYAQCSGREKIEETLTGQVPAPQETVEVTIDGRPVSIEQDFGNGVVRIRSQEEATTKEKLRIAEGSIEIVTPEGVTEVTHMPEDASQAAIDSGTIYRINRIELVNENGRPVYQVEGSQRYHILWIIPASRAATVRVDAGSNEVLPPQSQG